MISFTRVTWYSKLAWVVVVIGILPLWSFYLGTVYEKALFDIENVSRDFQYAPYLTSRPVDSLSSSIEVTLPNKKRAHISVYDKDQVSETMVEDINFDGYDDVRVVYNAGAYNRSTDYHVYNKDKDAFEKYDTPAFVDAPLGDVEFNPKTKTLASFFKGRGLGDIYVENTFTFVNNQWYLSKTEQQDIINFGEDPQYYEKITREFDAHKNIIKEEKTYFKNLGTVGEFDLQPVTPQEAQATRENH